MFRAATRRLGEIFHPLAVVLVTALLPAAAGAGPAVTPSPSVEAVDSAHSDELVVHAPAGFPAILIFDFPSLAGQGEMFNRAVALVERRVAPRDRVLSDLELGELIRSLGKQLSTFAFGNDFRVGELVRFFNLADEDGVTLNRAEETLRGFLLDNGLAEMRDGGIQAAGPERVILSIPAVQAADGQGVGAVRPELRSTILRHEMGHGEYHTNPRYAEYCADFWFGVMSEAERQSFTEFLASKNYDPGNPDLVINETQAYLIHTPNAAAFSPAMVGLSPEAVLRLRDAFWAGGPPTALSRP